MVGVPAPISQGMGKYRDLFCREAGFEQVSRSVTGVILRPNKTLQGLPALQGWGEDSGPSRRPLHEAVCAAGWAAAALMPHHRRVIAPEHRGRGREVLRLDWTAAHPERGPQMGGVKKAGDHGEHRLAPSQTVVPAVRAQRDLIAGGAVVGPPPDRAAEEVADLPETVRESADPMEAARGRCLAWLPPLRHRLGDKQRPESAREMAQPLDQAGHVPLAHDAFDHGGWTREWTRCSTSVGTHGVSARESARPLQWPGQGRRVDAVAAGLRAEPPESVRPVTVRCRKGETTQLGVCTTGVRLQRSGRKRWVLVHEPADREDTPRFLLTDARHGESGRVLETWSDRWAAEILHEFGQQVTGLEAAQGRKEAAVTRHCRLRGLAQSLVQRPPASGSTSERVAFAQGASPVGQRVRTIARDALHGLRKFVEQLLMQGRSCEQILEVLMPAYSSGPTRPRSA
jgi:hypothetical protein